MMFESIELRKCLGFGEPHVNESLANRLDNAEVEDLSGKAYLYSQVRIELQAQEKTGTIRV